MSEMEPDSKPGRQETTLSLTVNIRNATHPRDGALQPVLRSETTHLPKAQCSLGGPGLRTTLTPLIEQGTAGGSGPHSVSSNPWAHHSPPRPCHPAHGIRVALGDHRPGIRSVPWQASSGWPEMGHEAQRSSSRNKSAWSVAALSASRREKMCFCFSDLSPISLQSCSWGAHHRLRQRETDNALSGAQQVAEPITCLSAADLQPPSL